MTRCCAYCGADISHRRTDARYCDQRCSKAKPCCRCGGPKERGQSRACVACEAVLRSADHSRDLDRARWRRDREAALAGGQRLTRRQAPEGQKWCAECQSFLPLTSFGKNGVKPSAYCIPCQRDYNHRRSLERNYGITPEVYEQLLILQDGRCAICLTRPRKRRLAVDHDHETGEVRGLLCTRCNHGILGKAHDSAEMLTRAAAYLLHPPARTGQPVAEHTEVQADLEFLHEALPFLTDGELALHATRDLVGITAPTFLALIQAAGWALVVEGKDFRPPRAMGIDDLPLVKRIHHNAAQLIEETK